MNPVNRSTQIEQWLAREQIRTAIFTLQRGIDRRDAGLMRSAFHADGSVHYGFFDGPADEFASIMSTPADQAGSVTMHRASNVWVAFDGDDAISESYVVAYSPGPEGHALIGGRYLDRHAQRNGAWRITERTYVLDWNINGVATGTLLNSYATPFTRGRADTRDTGGRFTRAWTENPPNAGDQPVQSDTHSPQQIHDAIARSQIRELIAAQARGVDRADTRLLRTLFHDDARVDIGEMYAGDPDGFCALMAETARNLTRMAHHVSNEWIDVRGSTAVAETYVMALATSPADDGDADTISGGRYLDRFEDRGEGWKFAARQFVLDWAIEQPSTDQRDEPGGMLEALTTRGTFFPDDPVYALWSRQ